MPDRRRDERTPLRIYLNEMGQEELIDRDREIVLGQTVMEGTFSLYDHLIRTETFDIAILNLQNRVYHNDDSLDSQIDTFIESHQSNGKGISDESCQELRKFYEAHDSYLKPSKEKTITKLHETLESYLGILEEAKIQERNEIKFYSSQGLEPANEELLPEQKKFKELEKGLGISYQFLRKHLREDFSYNISNKKFQNKACIRALNEFARANLRLVVSIARRHTNLGLEYDDLIQEGNIGLMKGAEKFDHTKGYKFSTYAHWWIEQSISRAVDNQGRVIRIPVHYTELIKKVKKIEKAHLTKTGKEATDEFIADYLELKIEKVEEIRRFNRQEPISLDYQKTIDGEESKRMVDFVEQDKVASQTEILEQISLKRAMDRLLSTLTTREERILRMRFGIGFRSNYTLEEVGKEFEVTRERIRQIESGAIRKLRNKTKHTWGDDFELMSGLREYLQH